MPPNIIPWEPGGVPLEIQKELDRRKTVRGLNFVNNQVGGWDSDSGDWVRYTGPMAPWVRICSNGLGRPKQEFKNGANPLQVGQFDKPRFVLYGGKEFYETYGFKSENPSSISNQIIGHTPEGIPHVVESSLKSEYPVGIPTPEITKITSTIQKELFRRVTIEWTCFSSKQLEYMTPYFLIPGISVIVEYGWNHFNPKSLLDLTDIDNLVDVWNTPYTLYTDNILWSKGNYEVIFGIITNFNWSVEGNKFLCQTEITSKDRLYAGLSTAATVVKNVGDPNEGTQAVEPISSLREFVKSCLNDVKSLAKCKDLKSLTGANADIWRQMCKDESNNPQSGDSIPEEYWRGIFFGRDKDTPGMDHINDFDREGSNVTWVNMGFIIGLLNYKCTAAAVKGSSSNLKYSFFKVNADQCVIGAHPNLISIDGSKLLIPNSVAPKYFYTNIDKMRNIGASTDWIDQHEGNVKFIKKGDPLYFADTRLNNIFKQSKDSPPFNQGQVHRDDLDVFINDNRYFNSHESKGTTLRESGEYSFPFASVEKIRNEYGEIVAEYDPNYYGYFVDLYINLEFFKNELNSSGVLTYVDLYDRLFKGISSAAGEYWDFQLIDGSEASVGSHTGKKIKTPATMKIIDSRIMPSGNGTKNNPIYSFDYYDRDSIIKSINFKPILSNAQATRIIFSKMNNQTAKVSIRDGNDLLNYEFKDLILAKASGNTSDSTRSDKEEESFKSTREVLQNPKPLDRVMYQMTQLKDGKNWVTRLVLPDDTMIRMLLDDDDVDRNTKYYGIQPGITLELTLQGIGGLRTFQMFLVKNLPKPYSHKDVIFRITDVTHNIENGQWETVIKAGLLPLRGYLKKKLQILD